MAGDLEEFLALKKQNEELKTKKIRLEEQHRSKKAQLAELIAQIKEKGYDPNKLKDIIATKEQELKKSIEEFRASVEKASAQLAQIEV